MHIIGKDLSFGSRIMAVADVFTAISEDRPYRLGMSKEEAISTLEKMVENKQLDGKVVDLLINNYADVNLALLKAQDNAYKNYEEIRNKYPFLSLNNYKDTFFLE